MKNTVFGFGLVGSVVGLLGSLIWIFLGTDIWSAFFMGVSGFDYPTDANYGFGLIVSLFQSLITSAGFGITLFRSLPRNVERNPRRTGLWILLLGIGIFVINLSLFIPCILLIIAGVVAMNGKNNSEKAGL